MGRWPRVLQEAFVHEQVVKSAAGVEDFFQLGQGRGLFRPNPPVLAVSGDDLQGRSMVGGEDHMVPAEVLMVVG